MCAVGAQVCDQWREAAIKAGIPTNEIGVYTGKYGVLPNATHPLASSATRYTLTTIHRLQADAKRGTAFLLANCSTTSLTLAGVCSLCAVAFDSWEQTDHEPGFKYSPSPLALQMTLAFEKIVIFQVVQVIVFEGGKRRTCIGCTASLYHPLGIHHHTVQPVPALSRLDKVMCC